MIKNVLLALSLLTAGDFAYANKACKADKEKFCSACEKENKDCIKKCMKENKDKLSAECKAEKAKHKKSKDKRSEWDKSH